MRIDLYGAAEVPAERTGVGVTSVVQASSKAIPEDTATLSSGSLSVPLLAEQALKLAEERYAKVDTLNRAVNSGAYTLDPTVIAHALATSRI